MLLRYKYAVEARYARLRVAASSVLRRYARLLRALARHHTRGDADVMFTCARVFYACLLLVSRRYAMMAFDKRRYCYCRRCRVVIYASIARFVYVISFPPPSSPPARHRVWCVRRVCAESACKEILQERVPLAEQGTQRVALYLYGI